MEKTVPLTKEFYDLTVEKLRHMEDVERAQITTDIKIAREYGDLSENSEYAAAKEAQVHLETDIAFLTDLLRIAYVIDSKTIKTKVAGIGNIVTIYDFKFDEEETYKLVTNYEASIAQKKISIDSPLGAALLGKSKGDTVFFQTPGGQSKIQIMNISK